MTGQAGTPVSVPVGRFPAVDAGHVVADKYELVRLLGGGSMGEVWVAHHRTLGEQVALKLLTQNLTDGELEDPRTAAARFLLEAQVAARLSRKTRHIVRVTDHGEEDGVVYLVMELLDGSTLDAELAGRGRLPVPIVAEIVRQVSRALVHAHGEGVMHRDLKPANVFLTRDEEDKLLVKLLDFGIARVIHSHRAPTFSTAKGFVFGTPSYMSPEQARASSKLDHRCDLWALATIAYEALSGALPVDGQDTDELLQNLCAGRIVALRKRSPELPLVFEALFKRAFAERIDDRFQSATEFAAAFAHAAASTEVDRDVMTHPAIPIPEPSRSGVDLIPDEPAPEPPRWRVGTATLVVCGAVIVLLGLAAVLRTSLRSPATPVASPPRAEEVAPVPPASLTPPPAPAPVAPPSASPVVDVPAHPRGPLHLAPVPASPDTRTSPAPRAVSSPVPLAPPAPTPAPTPKKVDKSEVL